jgi:hypothetical protein
MSQENEQRHVYRSVSYETNYVTGGKSKIIEFIKKSLCFLKTGIMIACVHTDTRQF